MERGHDPLQNSLTFILQYLNDRFRPGLASQTINSLRSMLSMSSNPIDGHRIGEHPLVVRLLKGCFYSKPPHPRYQIMWDPDGLLTFFSTLPDNEDLTFKVHSHKLATLIAWSCLLRVSEMTAISLASVNFSTSAATFSIFRPQKTQNLGPLRSFTLSRLGGHSCPVLCLTTSIERSVSLRQPDSDALFIS
jgi:hypothetical protein